MIDDLHFDLEGVHLRYRDATALAGVSLRIRRGERVALVGPSGAGKTSLLHVLNGSRRVSRGRIRVCGRGLTERSSRELRRLRSEIGFVPQQHALVPNLSVLRNVLSGRLGRQSLPGSLAAMLWPRRAQLLEAHALLESVGIEEKLFQRTERLSGGEQQRVAVARALHQQPRALLADEPVASVDPARAREILDLLTRISEERSLTLCVSLHSPELARSCFSRLIGLRDGRIDFDLPSAQVDGARLSRLYALHRHAERDDGG